MDQGFGRPSLGGPDRRVLNPEVQQDQPQPPNKILADRFLIERGQTPLGCPETSWTGPTPGRPSWTRGRYASPRLRDGLQLQSVSQVRMLTALLPRAPRSKAASRSATRATYPPRKPRKRTSPAASVVRCRSSVHHSPRKRRSSASYAGFGRKVRRQGHPFASFR